MGYEGKDLFFSQCQRFHYLHGTHLLYVVYGGGGGGGGGEGEREIKPLINEGKLPIFIHEILIMFKEKVRN